jgi:hypothetical protein
MTCFAYNRTGSVVDNPDEKEMLKLLQSMESANSGHSDVSLNDDDGWSIAYSKSKTVIFSNPEADKGPWHMKGISVESALTLWLLLVKENMTELQSMIWVPGKG